MTVPARGGRGNLTLTGHTPIPPQVGRSLSVPELPFTSHGEYSPNSPNVYAGPGGLGYRTDVQYERKGGNGAAEGGLARHANALTSKTEIRFGHMRAK